MAVCDLDERAAKVAAELEAAGGRAIGLAFDVADPDAATRAHDDAVAALGPVTVVIANAGIVDQIARADRLSPEGWRREVDVNLSGAFFTVRPALAGLRERRGGRIIVTSSVASMIGTEGQVAYAATKAGLGGNAQLDALEFPDGYMARLDSLRDLIDVYNREINDLDRRIPKMLANHQGYRAIQAIHGVAPILAAVSCRDR